ncbi:MAG: hypothetical protein A2X86_21040 [Bdellovibrionales bacterium GWA2_49_15]|nr:MAG: hypothetical protein A2X86_21040 [Bdellovibrionales bacterium GWA2_49_15]HAZ14865.1 hypothetical protein [Bdellovibrionales bacterium]
MKNIITLITFFLQFYAPPALAVVWKNMDVSVEVFADKKVAVKEKHDLIFEEGDQSIVLPFFATDKQSIVLKKIELIDMIKNQTLPIPPLPPAPSAKEKTSTTAIAPAIYYTYSLQNVLTIELPITPNKTYNLAIEYEIQGALREGKREGKEEVQLKYTWGHPRRNGSVKYFSFNLVIPSDWTALEGAHKNISRENMAPKDQFMTDLHLRSLSTVATGPKALVELDEIYSCQLESNLPEQIFRAYLPDLPPAKTIFPTSSPMSFRLKGTPDGTVNLQSVGVENNISFSFSDEQKAGLGEKNMAYFTGRFETEKVRITGKLNAVVHTILFATVNLYAQKEVETGKTIHFTNNDPSAPAKNFDVTVLDESITIIASSLKLSLRNPVSSEVEGIKMLSSTPSALLSDTDISSIAFTFNLLSCKKI